MLITRGVHGTGPARAELGPSIIVLGPGSIFNLGPFNKWDELSSVVESPKPGPAQI